MKKEREIIGPFVVTTKENLSDDGIYCACCEKKLSNYDESTDEHKPCDLRF